MMRRLAPIVTLLAAVTAGNATAADEPHDPTVIARSIDRAIRTKWPADTALASDADFLRRACLDITGRIPSAEQARSFLADRDPLKRQKLVDALLGSPNYGRHFAVIWRELTVKEDNRQQLDTTAYSKWLADSFNANRRWDAMVTDLLTAEGKLPAQPQGLFLVAHSTKVGGDRHARQLAPDQLAAATAKLFLGVQLECAQCHDHFSADELKQDDFWGLAAFFNRTQLSGTRHVRTEDLEPVLLVEPVLNKYGKAEVGNNDQRTRLDPKKYGNALQAAVPDATDPAKTVRIVPARYFHGDKPTLQDNQPARPLLAKWLTARDNPYFAKATANRLWASFFARGVVHPLNRHHETNPPSNSELLDVLTAEMKRSGFDLKHMIRCICRTEAYQRTGKLTADALAAFAGPPVKVMSADVLHDAVADALGVDALAEIVRPRKAGTQLRPLTLPGRVDFVKCFDTRSVDADPTELGHGIPQFLRLMNDPQFIGGGRTVPKLMADPNQRAELLDELFLTTLARFPTGEERQQMADFVATGSDPAKRYAGVLWVLLNSAEFSQIK